MKNTTSSPWKLTPAKYDEYSNCFICNISSNNFVFAKIAGRTEDEANANGNLFFCAKDLFGAVQLGINLLNEEYLCADISPTVQLMKDALKEAQEQK